MKKIACLLYTFLVVFASCEDEVDYQDLGLDNFIVVNASFIDGETPWCQVSRSDIVFDQIKKKMTPTVFFPNANVAVTGGNADYRFSVIGDSAKMEAKGLIAQAGETYTLKAHVDGFDDAYTIVTVPNKPKAEIKIVNVETKYYDADIFYFIDPSESPVLYNITYELNIEDDPNTEDYYQISFLVNSMHYKYEYGVVDSTYGYWDHDSQMWIYDGKWHEKYDYYPVDSFMQYDESDYLIVSDDPVMNWNKRQSDDNLLGAYDGNPMNIFNDQLFNGQTSKIRFSMTIVGNSSESYLSNIFQDPIYFQLRHITKETYMYYRTSQLVYENDMSGSLSQYMLYCNVEHGAGLVAAWSTLKGVVEVPSIVKKE